MKKAIKKQRLCTILMGIVALLSGCGSEIDNPVETSTPKEVLLKNFSNTGCKPAGARTRADEEVVSSIELAATENGGVYIKHNDVILNCGIRDYNAVIEVDGNKITVTETGDASMQAWCNCNVDFGYEIGPLVEGTSYELNIHSEHNRSANKTINFVYSPNLEYRE